MEPDVFRLPVQHHRFLQFGGAPAVSHIEETPAPYAAGTGLILDGCAPAESESSGPTPVGSPRVPDGRQVNHSLSIH